MYLCDPCNKRLIWTTAGNQWN